MKNVSFDIPKNIEKYGVTGVALDSRKVRKGDVFFAITGQVTNGNFFIQDALRSGANLVITDNKAYCTQENIIYVEHIKKILSETADYFYPKKSKNLIAITGTNGKTSVAYYCHQLLELLGESCCSIGTLGVMENGVIDSNNFTTPDHILFRQILNSRSRNEYLVFEASSHGLAEDRLHQIKIKAAAFTSFSQDHLDYHKDMQSYLDAKLKLFSDNLEDGAFVVLNSDIPVIQEIKDFLSNRSIPYFTVGTNGDMKIISAKQSISGQIVKYVMHDLEGTFSTDIIGSFQATNLLIAAMLVSKVGGYDFETVIALLPKLAPVIGRLQRITTLDHQYQVFVDYAHTPDAIQNSLTELAKIKPTDSKLKVLFGCGGNRDISKRRIMGEIASRIADSVIITDDNPRNENPDKIRNDILEGAGVALEIPDRFSAIKQTIENLNTGDILLIAGKGHEDYQIIGDKRLKFSDIEIAKNILYKV